MKRKKEADKRALMAESDSSQVKWFITSMVDLSSPRGGEKFDLEMFKSILDVF